MADIKSTASPPSADIKMMGATMKIVEDNDVGVEKSWPGRSAGLTGKRLLVFGKR